MKADVTVLVMMKLFSGYFLCSCSACSISMNQGNEGRWRSLSTEQLEQTMAVHDVKFTLFQLLIGWWVVVWVETNWHLVWTRAFIELQLNSWAEWIKFHIYQSSWAGQMWAVSEVRVVLCFINKLQCRLGGGRGSGQASLVVTTSWKWSCHEILTSTEI